MKKNMIVAFAVMMMQAVAVTAQTPKQTIYKPEQVEQRAMFQGTVVVHFVVEADGSISDVHVPDSQKVHPVLNAAAVQFVRNMPKWKPASLKGKAVRQRASHAVAYRYQ